MKEVDPRKKRAAEKKAKSVSFIGFPERKDYLMIKTIRQVKKLKERQLAGEELFPFSSQKPTRLDIDEFMKRRWERTGQGKVPEKIVPGSELADFSSLNYRYKQKADIIDDFKKKLRKKMTRN